ncbi:hypothetical protein EDB86DRAFT_651150 [Lactarius hatsudake]|nr:hypothetical protein EDB86DRAFT_651150 [Lactarius hatsudake]
MSYQFESSSNLDSTMAVPLSSLTWIGIDYLLSFPLFSKPASARQKQGSLWAIDCEPFCPLKASSHPLRLYHPSGRVPLCRASGPPTSARKFKNNNLGPHLCLGQRPISLLLSLRVSYMAQYLHAHALAVCVREEIRTGSSLPLLQNLFRVGGSGGDAVTHVMHYLRERVGVSDTVRTRTTPGLC